MTDKLFAFVLMPFSKDFDDIYRLGIKETAEECGMIAERVDEQFYTEGMLERIYNQIEAADLIIADMTGKNANVFYEVGYAHAKQKLCILLTKEASDIPFDLKHHQHIVYGSSITGLKSTLEKHLTAIKAIIEERKVKAVDIELTNKYGHLSITKFNATAEIDLKFDFHNRSGKASPEIEQIYVYTGDGWRFKSNGRSCPSTISDISDYKKRHLVEPPVRRLQKSAWAQMRLECQKIVASSIRGDEIKDSYRLTGSLLIRMITSDGAMDYPFILDVLAEDVPF